MSLINVTRDPDYSDIDMYFQINPITKDLNILTGNDAIKRSIRNLIFTEYFERPFKSNIGSDVSRLLFENVDPLTAVNLQNAIKTLINTFEPRVALNSVVAVADMDNYGFQITIQYTILNNSQPATVNLFLERIR
jgi:phage baseplate assembly protein W